MAARINRYAVGVVAVAAVGLFALAGCVWLLIDQNRRLEAVDDVAASVRRSAEAVRDLLEADVRARGRPAWTLELPPGDARPPAELGEVEHYAGFAAYARAPAGPDPRGLRPLPTFASDDASYALPFLPPSPHPGGIRIAEEAERRPGEGPRFTAAFYVPRDRPSSSAVAVNVQLAPPDPRALHDRFRRIVFFGAVVLALVIYLLGVLAIFLRGQGAVLLAQEREKAIRLKAVSEVAGGIAHELRNPLNAIGLSVQVIERRQPPAGVDAAQWARHFERVYTEIGRIKKVTDGFVKFARLGDLTVAPFDFRRMVREILDGFAPVCADARVEVDFAPGREAPVTGDQEKLGEAVAAVVQSGVDAMREEGGRLVVRLAVRRREVALSVRDSGPAPDAESLRTIFEPYRRGAHEGGFALTVAKTIVESHGGRIDASSPPGGGRVVSMAVPRRFARA